MRVDWVLREMRSEEGAFYSALDADSDGEEGWILQSMLSGKRTVVSLGRTQAVHRASALKVGLDLRRDRDQQIAVAQRHRDLQTLEHLGRLHIANHDAQIRQRDDIPRREFDVRTVLEAGHGDSPFTCVKCILGDVGAGCPAVRPV